MTAKKRKDLESIRELVNESISTHNEEFLINLIYKLQIQYNELAQLSTLGQFKNSWSHKKLLDYITKES